VISDFLNPTCEPTGLRSELVRNKAALRKSFQAEFPDRADSKIDSYVAGAVKGDSLEYPYPAVLDYTEDNYETKENENKEKQIITVYTAKTDPKGFAVYWMHSVTTKDGDDCWWRPVFLTYMEKSWGFFVKDSGEPRNTADAPPDKDSPSGRARRDGTGVIPDPGQKQRRTSQSPMPDVWQAGAGVSVGLISFVWVMQATTPDDEPFKRPHRCLPMYLHWQNFSGDKPKAGQKPNASGNLTIIKFPDGPCS
jgi:hypothetical protein